MSMTRRDPNFFVAGGTLHSGVLSYVKRPADDLLPRLVTAGELCYVLTTRQMGKSSLMVRTAHKLQNQKNSIKTVIIDLSAIGLTTIEQWYYSVVDEIAYQLNLTADTQAWWQHHGALEYSSRFMSFLRDVVLTEVSDQVVIFIDEVDSIIKYDFSDDLAVFIYLLWPGPDLTNTKAIHTDQPPSIDGRLDDEVWSRAQPLTFAKYNEANDSTIVTVRLLWDDEHLYAGFDINDAYVESSQTPWDGDSVSVIIKNGPKIQEYRHSLVGVEQADTRGQLISKHYLKEMTNFNDSVRIWGIV